MKFLHPSFLYFLVVLAIPVIIHLFQFRRYKTVYFSSVRFLRKVEEEKRQTSRIKHWLVLLSRLLFLTCLVLAFAQPYFPDEQAAAAGTGRAVSMYVDNSFSMESAGELQSLFESARQRGYQLTNAARPTDDLQVLSNRFLGTEQFLLSPDKARQALSDLDISPESHTVAEIMERQRAALAESEKPRKQAFLLSDFQEGMLQEIPAGDSAMPTVLVPLEPNYAQNVYVDSLWWENPVLNPGQTEAIHFRLANAGTEARQVTARLWLDGEMMSLLTVSLNPNTEVDTSLSLPLGASGWHSGRVEVQDPSIAFDNALYFTYRLEEALPLAELYGPAASERVSLAYATESFFNLERVSAAQADFSQLRQRSVWVLNGIEKPSSGLAEESRSFVRNGGSLIIFLPERADLTAWNALLERVNGPQLLGRDTANGRVDDVFTDHPLYRNVFESIPENARWPEYSTRWVLRSRQTYTEALWKHTSGDALFTESIIERGRTYVCALPLNPEASNVTEHPIFLTTLFRTAFLSVARDPLYYTLGKDHLIPLPESLTQGENYFELRSEDGERSLVPQLVLNAYRPSLQLLAETSREAGMYYLVKENERIGRVALNYDRSESVPRYHSAAELESWIESNGLTHLSVLDTSLSDFEASLQQALELETWWRFLLILALVFVLIEVLLIRFIP